MPDKNTTPMVVGSLSDKTDQILFFVFGCLSMFTCINKDKRIETMFRI